MFYKFRFRTHAQLGIGLQIVQIVICDSLELSTIYNYLLPCL